MFFGKMQSFYRRNSLHHQSPAHGSQTKPKDHFKRVKHLNKNEAGEDDDEDLPYRRRSFSISRNTEYEDQVVNYNQTDIPIIKIGLYEPEPTKKSFNILKEKERALWFNSCPEPDDNSERLGPNKNNIIEESLEIERTRQNQDDC